MQEGSLRAVLFALCANLGVAIAKFAGYAATGAASLLAEGVHSVADCSNQLLLLFGSYRARRGPTPEHPFGYGPRTVLLGFRCRRRALRPGRPLRRDRGRREAAPSEPRRIPGWGIGILVVAMCFEAVALRTAAIEARKHKGTESWWAFLRRAKTAELSVVLLEDAGALLGLSLALVSLILVGLTGQSHYDAFGSIAIGGLLGGISVFLGVEMRSLLIGEAASPAVQRAIRRILEEQPPVRRLVHMRTQHLGPDELLIGAKLEFDPELTVAAAAAAVDAAEVALRAQLPAARVVYLEVGASSERCRAKSSSLT